jgi:hypothetical protein
VLQYNVRENVKGASFAVVEVNRWLMVNLMCVLRRIKQKLGYIYVNQKILDNMKNMK